MTTEKEEPSKMFVLLILQLMMRIQPRFRARAVTQRRASFALFFVLPRTAPEGQGGSLLDATPVEITAQVFE